MQVRAETKWLQQIGEDGRVILRAGLGAMVVDDFDALPPELRFFAGGDRSIRGFDYQEIGDLDAAGEVIGGEYQASPAPSTSTTSCRTGAPQSSSTPAMRSRSFSMRTSAPASACAGNRRSGWCGWTSRGRWSTDFDHSWRVHLVIGPDL